MLQFNKKLVLKRFLGNFKCFKRMFHVLRGGSENSKFSQYQIFPKLGPRGGVVKLQIFPKFKKVQNILGEGGGVKKIVDFFHFLGIFFFNASLRDLCPNKSRAPKIESQKNILCPIKFGAPKLFRIP